MCPWKNQLSYSVCTHITPFINVRNVYWNPLIISGIWTALSSVLSCYIIVKIKPSHARKENQLTINVTIKNRLKNPVMKTHCQGWNLTRIMGTLHEDPSIFMIISCSILLRMIKASDKICRENQNTHYMLNKFSPKNCAFYERRSKSVVQPDRPQMTT
jgi:hypothetical protein